MTTNQFIIAIISYILSLAASLVLMTIGKKIKNSYYLIAVYFHVFLLFLFAFVLTLNHFAGLLNSYLIYFSLVFFCSGVALSGLILRSKLPFIIKFYFGIFSASFLLFIISPSTLFSIITKGKIRVENYDRFKIAGNFYLDKQSSFLESKSMNYKVVQKLGYFNKTVSRDISFAHRLDSIKTLEFNPEKLAILRGYFSSQNIIDSIDVKIDFTVSADKNIITNKPLSK